MYAHTLAGDLNEFRHSRGFGYATTRLIIAAKHCATITLVLEIGGRHRVSSLRLSYHILQM